MRKCSKVCSVFKISTWRWTKSKHIKGILMPSVQLKSQIFESCPMPLNSNGSWCQRNYSDLIGKSRVTSQQNSLFAHDFSIHSFVYEALHMFMWMYVHSKNWKIQRSSFFAWEVIDHNLALFVLLTCVWRKLGTLRKNIG